MNTSDYNHNKNVLTEIKKALYMKEELELKSTNLKRHRYAREAYKIIAKLKGSSFSFVSFKKKMLEQGHELVEDKSKMLSGLSHVLPIRILTKLDFIEKDEKILIVIDRMKKTEETNIKMGLEFFHLTNRYMLDYKVIFRDSKDKKYPLIQIADIISGGMRDFFESQEIASICRYCEMNNGKRKFCKNKKIKEQIAKIKINDIHKIFIRLHCPLDKERMIFDHILSIPVPLVQGYKYLECKNICKKIDIEPFLPGVS